jgi:hypothetical protein
LAWVNSGFGHDSGDPIGERPVGELSSRHIHRDTERASKGPASGCDVVAGGTQGDVAKRDDQARVLGNVKEGSRCQQSALRMLPAEQRLDADDRASFEVDDRLVEARELVGDEPVPDLALQLQPCRRTSTHRVVE